MALFSTFGANSVLNGTAIPATLYFKPHVGNPGAAGTANAAAETTRKSFTRTTAAGSGNSNAADIDYTNVGTAEDWTHFTAWDAATAGNCWIVGTVTMNALAVGDDAKIAAGDLDLILDIWS